MTKRKQHILVTGGAGFIGSHVVGRALAEGYQVSCIDNFSEGYACAIKERNIREHIANQYYNLYKVDITDALQLTNCIQKIKPNIVIHLAACAGVRRSFFSPLLYEKVNVQGTVNLLEACTKLKIDKFIFASSSSVYGLNSNAAFSEEAALLQPISPYAATKIAGEALCHSFSYAYNLPVVVLRFFSVYGPGQRPDLAIHKFIRLACLEKSVPIYGSLATGRDYTYIDDIVAGVMAAIDYCHNRYEIFNLGTSRLITLYELLKTIEFVLDRKLKIAIYPPQQGDVPLTIADITKAEELLHYRPGTSIRKGIENFYAWFLSQEGFGSGEQALGQ